MYDSWIQHGASDPGSKIFNRSANGLAALTNAELGGSPLSGVDEVRWLATYLAKRRELLSNGSDVWKASAPRVDVFAWLLQLQDGRMDKPISLQTEMCAGSLLFQNQTRGPCTMQVRRRRRVGARPAPALPASQAYAWVLTPLPLPSLPPAVKNETAYYIGGVSYGNFFIP